MVLLDSVKIGFAGRVTLMIGAFIFVSAASVGLGTYSQLNDILIKKEFSALNEKTAAKARVLERYFSEFSRDALYRSYTAPMIGFIEAYWDQTTSTDAQERMGRWRARMQENFVSMLTAKPYYIQLRFIGLDNQARELVRVERRGSQIEVVPDEALQAKIHTHYLQEGLKLRQGEVYLSELDLNREHGEISEPRTLVLRAVAPVYTAADVLFGMIVIHIDFSALAQEIFVSEHGETTYLINQRGDFLVHPDPDKQYAFESGRRFTSAQEFGIAVERLPSAHDFLQYNRSTASGDEALGFAYNQYRYDPRNSGRMLTIIDAMPIKAVLKDLFIARSRAASVSLVLIIGGMALALLLSRRLVRQIGGEPDEIEAITRRVAEGDLDIEFDRPVEASTGIFASVRRMVVNLKDRTEETRQQTWLQTELVRLLSLAQTAHTIDQLSRQIITELATLLGMGYGAFFIRSAEENGTIEGKLLLLGRYAYSESQGLSREFRLGEGLVGQCALAKQPILVSNAPGDYVKISSGLGEAKPLTIIAQPIVYDDATLGVLELATFTALTDIQRELLSRIADNLGGVIQKIWNQERTDRLLNISRQLITEAQIHAEELRATNKELEEQSEELQALNAEIEAQSEEIQTAYQELEEKSELLETHIQEIARKSADIEKMSQSKSEFLANMSHELRTPLNSLLILSKSLEENREGNLTEQQIEAARVIHSGGQELLTLTDDILDLSKIEAARLLPQREPVVIANVLDYLRKQFEPVAQTKAITFEVLIEDEIPTTIITDEQRLVQILRNLFSNAFKFTSEGRVELRVEGDRDASEDHAMIAFTVSDTGIGIAEDRLTSVFEAFQQGDGSTYRRYGGTGLGLTISRELAELLGGQISVQSCVGEGSRFTLHLPVSEAATAAAIVGSQAQRERLSEDEVPAGRSPYELLVIGEELLSPQAAGELLAIDNVRITTAASGQEGLGLLQARRFDGLMLDLQLAGIPSADLLNIIVETPSIPCPQIILCTTQELSGDERRALQRFSQTLVMKNGNTSQRLLEEVRLCIHQLDHAFPSPLPSVRHQNEADMTLKGTKMLMVDNDMRNMYQLANALDERGIDIVMANNGQLALDKLEQEDDVALIVIDIMMSEMDGYETMRRIREMQPYQNVPIIALTVKAMPEDRSKCIAAGASDYLTKPVNIEELLSMMTIWLDSRR